MRRAPPGPLWPRTLALVTALVVSAVVLFAPSPPGTPAFPLADKVVHVAVFALVTATAVWRLGRVRWVLAAACTYAVASEAVQGLVLPVRQADPRDVVADLVGVLAVWALAARTAGMSDA